MRFEDYSEMLDVGADADAAAIQQACRRHARLLHPDINTATDAHAAMARINEADEVLSAPPHRAAHDGVRRRHLALRAATKPADGGPAREGPGAMVLEVAVVLPPSTWPVARAVDETMNT